MEKSQDQSVEEYMKNKHCFAAWNKDIGTLYILYEGDDTAIIAIMDLLFDNQFKVEKISLSDWQYYSERVDEYKKYGIAPSFYVIWIDSWNEKDMIDFKEIFKLK